MKRTRYDYIPTQIVSEWRKDKEIGYAVRIGKKFNIPSKVVHNVIYWHRRKKSELDRKYREGKASPKISKKGKSVFGLQSHVVYVSASCQYSSRMIIV
jgi:hypothetical protein